MYRELILPPSFPGQILACTALLNCVHHALYNLRIGPCQSRRGRKQFSAPYKVRDGFPVQEIEVKYMKQIFKDVLSCKSLRDGLKQAILAIVVAILERTIIALKGGTNNVRYIDV